VYAITYLYVGTLRTPCRSMSVHKMRDSFETKR